MNVALVAASCSQAGQGSRRADADNNIQNPSDGACESIDIRNSVEGFKKLENCTVIEGKLHILLIDHADEKDYEKYRFPLLREITGHLLLYRVYGLKTLRHIFPNLAVIRGQDLFYNYALVAYEMPDLEEIGLVSLTTIMRGAVRLTKNKRLCYVDTIDWSSIAVGMKESDHHIQENKDPWDCVNYCPENCPQTVVNDRKDRRCWTSEHCQKNLDCDSCRGKDKNDTTPCMDGGKCCHSSCIGGCTGPDKSQCVVCRHVIYDGHCHPRCPPTTYRFMERRCLKELECLNLSRDTDRERWKLLKTAPAEPNQCVHECPRGFMPNYNQTECIRCNNSCPKVCLGKVVDSIDSAQHLKGCNTISGPLEIQIMGGSNIGLELEESLGDIEEVTQYIKIVRSYALISLHFFRNLRIIGGAQVDKSYSLRVIDNSNMQELFTDEVTANLKILNGKVSFHSNRKLCLERIDILVKSLNITVTDMDVSRTTNGDLMPCSVKWLDLRVKQTLRNSVILEWQKAATTDPRQILNYIINYREISGLDNDVDIYQGRDACSEVIWKTVEIAPDQALNDTVVELVPQLKPWTTYAVYVQAYMLTTANHQAITRVINFTTGPDYPTSPVDLTAVAEVPGELLVQWKKPKSPNGNVTHYLVYWQPQLIDSGPFDQRDYCKNPIDVNRGSRPVMVDKKENNSSFGEGCCECPKSVLELKEEERERQIEIEFENYLHDHVYCKRFDALPAGIDEKYNLSNLTPLRKKRQIVDDPAGSENALNRYSANTNKANVPVVSTTGAPKTATAAPNATNATEENTFFQALIYDTKIHLMNLGHFEEYSIEVLACQETDPKSGEKLCSNRAITVARTKPKDDADNINASTIEARLIPNNTGEVMLTWKPPPDPNGLILKYLIRYRRANQEDHVFSQVCVSQKRYQAQGGGHRLMNIEPGNYSYEIAAVSLAGKNGSYTPRKFFIIPHPPEEAPKISETVVAVTIIGILLVIIIVVVIVWFVAKSRFTNQDMTVISPNPHYLPSDELYIPDEWEMPRDKIRLVKELGQGSFGMVYEGIAEDLIPGSGDLKVAIKTVNDNAGFQERMNFLKEATTMKAFDCYHVVKLLGVVSKGQPALVIMELMSNGDLKNYLRMHRPDEIEQNPALEPISFSVILQMAGEIADGMAYLTAKKFVHRDLAARNCMVSDVGVVKIGDFGMTRDIYETDYYRKGGKGLLPVRWMAPESLKDGVFTIMSDMWSYGVVLWEMATLACQPYGGLSNEEVVKFVVEGRIMDRPPGCPQKLCEIMQNCWRFKARDRPTFKSIIESLIPHLNNNFEKVSYFFTGDDTHSDNGDNPHCSQLGTRALGGGGGDADKDGGMGDLEGIEDIDLDDVGFAMIDSHEESRIPFMIGEDLSHCYPVPLGTHTGSPPNNSSHSHSQRSPAHSLRGVNLFSPSGSSAVEMQPLRGAVGGISGSGSGSPLECVMMEELPNGHRISSPCSSPTSANAPSDDSKGSSKSSGSYSRMNGLANGHIFNPYKRTAPC